MPALLTALLGGYVEGSTSALQLVEQWVRKQGLEAREGDAPRLTKAEVARLYAEIAEPGDGDV